MFPWIAGIIFVVIIALFVLAWPAFKVSREEFERTGKHPKGYYVGIGMAIGIVLGMPLGIALDMPGIGPAMGLPIGLAIGLAWEKQHEKELREPTEKEIEMKKRMVLVLLGLAILGALAFAALFFLRIKL